MKRERETTKPDEAEAVAAVARELSLNAEQSRALRAIAQRLGRIVDDPAALGGWMLLDAVPGFSKTMCCLYMHVYIDIHTCIHIYVHTYTHTYIHAYMCLRVC